MMNRRNLLIILAVILLAGVFYYRSAITNFFSSLRADVMKNEMESTDSTVRELTSTITFTVANVTEIVKFNVFVDTDGVITDVQSINVANPADSAHINAFNDALRVVIKGKKLADLTNIDKIGTSSYTTEAFNSALPELKAQL